MTEKFYVLVFFFFLSLSLFMTEMPLGVDCEGQRGLVAFWEF